MMIFLSREEGRVNPPSFTFFDFEATGKEPAIAEILTGYFRTVDAQTRNLISELEVKMKPDKWSFEAEKIHGLTEDLCKTFPDKKPMMRDIFRYIQANKESIFICHANYKVFGVQGYFDWQLLKKECLYLDVLHHFNSMFGSVKVFSTHTMAKDRSLPSKSYRLKDLAEYVGHEFVPHNCKEDTLATEAIFWHMIDNKTMLELMESE